MTMIIIIISRFKGKADEGSDRFLDARYALQASFQTLEVHCIRRVKYVYYTRKVLKIINENSKK